MNRSDFNMCGFACDQCPSLITISRWQKCLWPSFFRQASPRHCLLTNSKALGDSEVCGDLFHNLGTGCPIFDSNTAAAYAHNHASNGAHGHHFSHFLMDYLSLHKIKVSDIPFFAMVVVSLTCSQLATIQMSGGVRVVLYLILEVSWHHFCSRYVPK